MHSDHPLFWLMIIIFLLFGVTVIFFPTLSIVLPLVVIVFLIPRTLLINKKERRKKVDTINPEVRSRIIKEREVESRKRLRNSIIIVCALLIFEAFQAIKTISFRKELAGNSYMNGEMTDFGSILDLEHEYTNITLDFDDNNKCSIYKHVFIGSLDKKELPGELIGVYNYRLFRIITGDYVLYINPKQIYLIEAKENVPQGFSFVFRP